MISDQNIKKGPELQELLAMFEQNNSRQMDTLTQIKGRMGQLKKFPLSDLKEEPVATKESQVYSAIDAFNYELNKAKSITYLLEEVYAHLQTII